MAAIRRRFTPAEREAFTAGTAVEWLDATNWKPGYVNGPVEIDAEGWQVLSVENQARTGLVRRGEVIRVNAKHVRLAR